MSYLDGTIYMIYLFCVIIFKGVMFLLKAVWFLLKPLGRLFRSWLSDQVDQVKTY